MPDVPFSTTLRRGTLAGLLVCASAAFAQTATDAPADEAPPPVLAAPAPPPRAIAVLPSERSVDVQAHWSKRREYLRDRDERRADDEEQRVRTLKEDLGLENLFAIGAALVRESQGALAAGSPALARKLCKLAVELAPSLPEAHLCLARTILADQPGAMSAASAELVLGVAAAVDDPRVGHALTANAAAVVGLGAVIAGLVFVVLLFARHARLYVHDLHHAFPIGARRWQTSLLAVALVLSPLLLQSGFLPLAFTALLACALYASGSEIVLSCLLLGLLAAAPRGAESLGRVAAFAGPAADVWLVEHGEGTRAEVARLSGRLASARPEMAVLFTLAHKAKREGDLDQAERLYRAALDSSQGATNDALATLHNDLGNVYLLQNDAAKAIREYQQAIELVDALAAPHFNLSRALGMQGLAALEKVQAEQNKALELDRAAIDAFTGGQLALSRKSNKFVMDLPLEPSMVDPLLDAQAQIASTVGDEARALLGGAHAPTMLAAAAVLVLALHLVRGRIRPAGRCHRCGREVCKRCDVDARPEEALCAQCVNVFVRRTGIDPAERMRKEFSVESYRRRRRLVARMCNFVSGSGHVLLGYPITGILFLLVTGCLAGSVLLFRGVAHSPIAVRSGVSIFRIATTVAAFLAVYALCLRNLLSRQRAEGA
jgi:tetratricopeptide (TPR) repeat protein